MSRTTFSGPIRAGDIRNNQYKDVGTVLLNQYAVFDATVASDTATVTKNIYLPAGSRIVNIYTDVAIQYNSATSAAVTVGNVAAGTQYSASASVAVTPQRLTSVPTTQLAAWLATPIDVSGQLTGTFPVSLIAVTLTIVGVTTAGKVNVVVQYTQADDRSTFATQ